MKKVLKKFFIIWIVFLCSSFFSCPNGTTSNKNFTLNTDLLISSMVYTDTVLNTDTWILGSNIMNNGLDTAGSSTVRYYLSTDNVLDGGDTVIGDTTIPEIQTGDTYLDTYSTTYSIPTAGTYYIFVKVDVNSIVAETNEENNTASQSITVNAGSTPTADLLVSSMVYTDTVLTTDTWTLGSNIKNNGQTGSEASTVRYYLSIDNALDGGDTVIGDTAIPEIQTGDTILDTYSSTYNIPTSGTYYLFVEVDVNSIVAETDEENNTASQRITVNSAVSNTDLVITSITTPGTLQTTVDTWQLGTSVSNIGTGDSASSTLKYYLSEDNILDIPDDTLIGSKAIGTIAAGSFVDDVWSASYSINQGGEWYIFAVADADSEVSENEEGNNTLSESVNIKFDRIVIETFSPTGEGNNSTNTYLALFDSAGDPTSGTPYDDTDALAYNLMSNANHMWYSRIDTDVDMGGAGLAPGTYYIKVRGSSSNKTGPYGLRVVTDPAETYVYFGTTNPTNAPWDDSFENDDPMTGQIPDSPLSIQLGVQENWNNRALIESDIDWFILTLD